MVFVILAAVTAARPNSVVLEGDTSPQNLRWRRAPIQIAISSSLKAGISNVKSDSDVAGAIRRSLDAWRSAADVDFQIVNSDKQNVSSAASGDGVSLITIAPTPENLLLFSKNAELLSATTRVFFNKRGAITEADIVLNPYQQFSTDGTFGTFDLESVLTHEVGHLLGLEHSPLISATMHESYGRNGLYGLQNFSSRSLAISDIAAARARYGMTSEDEQCCGSISGTATFLKGKAAGRARVWIEDLEGRVASLVEAAPDGRFRFDGVGSGGYRIYAGPSAYSKTHFAVQMIGQVNVNGADETVTTSPLKTAALSLDLSLIGFNGQLSDLAVPANSGRTYAIYLGGIKIDEAWFSFSTPFITIIPNTFRTLDYGTDTTVVTVQIQIDPATPAGEYTVFARENATGAVTAIPGGISVGDSPNPFSIAYIQKF